MLVQCRTLVLNDAKVSHDEVHAFGGEPCRLFQSALHAVSYCVFLSVLTVTLMCWTSLYGHASSCTQCCA